MPPFATNTFSRPDSSGIRGGAKRKVVFRGGDFPYDRDVSYGQSAPYDRGSRKTAQFRFTRPADESSWDDVEEALGTPYLLSKDAPGAGSAIPGIHKGWASPPNIEPEDERKTPADDLRSEGAYLDTMTLNEAKKKGKKKKEKDEKVPSWLRPYPEEHPDKRFGYSEAFDFSAPLGPFNLYARQGGLGRWTPTLTGRSAWDPLMEFEESSSSPMRGSWADVLGLLEK